MVPPESRDLTRRYCICARQNDNQQYVMCEDECEWYHPKCVGFDPELFEQQGNQLKFFCPYCPRATKPTLNDLENSGKWSKIESRSHRNFYVYLPQKGAAITQTADNWSIKLNVTIQYSTNSWWRIIWRYINIRILWLILYVPFHNILIISYNLILNYLL